MPSIHEPEYHQLAQYYDVLNERLAPYDMECEFIERAFERYDKKVHRILDLACGTGIHALRLAKKRYEVVGIDMSSELLTIAREKATQKGVHIQFHQDDMMDLGVCGEFDAAICVNFSATLCITHPDICRFILGVRDALRSGGIFIVDFLPQYGTGESTAKESVEAESVKIDLIREWTHDTTSQILAEKMTYFVTKGGRTTRCEGYGERRIFYPQEMLFYLEGIGNFRTLGLHKRWSLDDRPIGPGLVAVAEKM